MSTSLAEWLRYHRAERLTGTKIGCGEGGCGACSVIITFPSPSSSSKSSSSFASSTSPVVANACLTMLFALDGCHVTTSEGLSSLNAVGVDDDGDDDEDNVIAKLMRDHSATQCGFCSPGVAVALHAARLRLSPGSSLEERETAMESALQGNLCRCTGYRPILAVGRALAAATCEMEDMDGRRKCGGDCSSSSSPECHDCPHGVHRSLRSPCHNEHGTRSFAVRRLVLRPPTILGANNKDDTSVFLSAASLQDVFSLLRVYRRSQLGSSLCIVAGGTAKGVSRFVFLYLFLLFLLGMK